MGIIACDVALAMSPQYLAHHIPIHIGEPEIASAVEVGEGFVIDSHEMKQRRVEVVDVDFVFDCVVTEIVGRSVMVAGFDSGAGEPVREAVRIVISSVLMAAGDPVKEFESGGAAKFAAANDKGVI